MRRGGHRIGSRIGATTFPIVGRSRLRNELTQGPKNARASKSSVLRTDIARPCCLRHRDCLRLRVMTTIRETVPHASEPGDRARDIKSHPTAAVRIDTVGIVTRNRLRSLERTLAALSRHLRQHG